jgi:hypothetical protein
MKQSLSWLAVLGVAAPAVSQPAFHAFPMEVRAWPTAISGDALFTGAACGHLTGAGYPDVVLLQAGSPVLFAAPATFNVLHTIAGAPSGCTAVATRHRERAASGRWLDQLVASNANGLWHWRYDGTTGSMKWDSVQADTLWSGLRSLVTAQLTDDDLQDLIGIGADQRTVGVLLASGTGYGVQYQRQFTSDVYAVAAVAWDDAESAAEIAVATADGLEICRLEDGLPTCGSVDGTACTAATLAVTTQGPGSAPLLALTIRAGSSCSLLCIEPGSDSPAQTVGLGGMDVVACAAGDIDGDLDDDLLYSQRHNHRVTVLLQIEGQFGLLPLAANEFSLIAGDWNGSLSTAPAPDNAATPVFADLDGDGLADMVHAVESNETLVIGRNPLGAASASVDSSRIRAVSTSEVHLELLLDPEVVPAGATHFEAVAWPLVYDDGFARDSNGTVSVDLEAATAGAQMSLAFSSAMYNNPNAALLVQVRAVQKQGGDIVRTMRPVSYIYMHDIGGLTTLPATQAWQAALSYKDPNLDVIEVEVVPTGYGIGGSGGGEIPVIPPPPPDPPPVGPG